LNALISVRAQRVGQVNWNWLTENKQWGNVFCITELFRHRVDKRLNAIVFSANGNLAIAMKSRCGLILDPRGEVLETVCGENKMSYVSYSNGRFGFITESGQVIITDEGGKVIKNLKIDRFYAKVIGMGPDGFVACNDSCGFFDFDGKMKWTVNAEAVLSNPVYYGGYWYIPEYGAGVHIVKDKRYGTEKDALYHEDENIVNTVPIKHVHYVDVCDEYLVATSGDILYPTNHEIHLFNIVNPVKPREMWKIDETKKQDVMGMFGRAVFSPRCRYIAVIFNEVVNVDILGGDLYEMYEGRVKIFSIRGKLMHTLKFEEQLELSSLDWKGRRLAVGTNVLGTNTLYEFEIEKIPTPFPIILYP